jgi:hypothetical protein
VRYQAKLAYHLRIEGEEDVRGEHRAEVEGGDLKDTLDNAEHQLGEPDDWTPPLPAAAEAERLSGLLEDGGAELVGFKLRVDLVPD